MEYKHITRWLFSQTDYGTMVTELCRDICRLAKRQETWFRNQLPELAWVDPEKALAAVEAQFLALAKPRSS